MRAFKGRQVSWNLLVVFATAIILSSFACRPSTDVEKESRDESSATVTFPILIRSSEGDEQIFAAGTQLPTTYSERFVTEESQQDSAGITISQMTPSGMEIIAEVDVPLPVQHENASVVVTVRVEKNRSLFVKASVMESGLVKEFGPFPIQ